MTEDSQKNPKAKLEEIQVKQVLLMSSDRHKIRGWQRWLSNIWNVSPTAISDVVCRRTWKKKTKKDAF